jgi:hypothetical protein
MTLTLRVTHGRKRGSPITYGVSKNWTRSWTDVARRQHD